MHVINVLEQEEEGVGRGGERGGGEGGVFSTGKDVGTGNNPNERTDKYTNK